MREVELGLIIEDNKLIVYQSFERGGYNIIKTFDNEEEACNLILYFLKLEKEEGNNVKFTMKKCIKQLEVNS